VLTIGFEGQQIDAALSQLLRDVCPGGVIFFQRNIVETEQFGELVAEISRVLPSPSPLLAMDLEGGLVDRFRELLAPLPSARDAARAGMARELGEMAGRELAAFGLNVDFAPVLDLGSAESEPILASRTAGQTPQEVIRFAERFLLGLTEWNVLGCGKHFPGLGGGGKDSHIGLPTIRKTEDALWQADLLPFRALAEQMPLIMVAHAWYPELEAALSPGTPPGPIPASLSSNLIPGLLRQRMSYTGLVVCDDLEMGGVLEGRTIEEAAVGAIRAGCDILLICRHAANVERVHRALARESEASAEFRERLAQATRRIAANQAAHPFGTSQTPFVNVEVLRREIQRLGERVHQRLARRTGSPVGETQER
jgi:beta-N-acetylhexosaminidase